MWAGNHHQPDLYSAAAGDLVGAGYAVPWCSPFEQQEWGSAGQWPAGVGPLTTLPPPSFYPQPPPPTEAREQAPPPPRQSGLSGGVAEQVLVRNTFVEVAPSRRTTPASSTERRHRRVHSWPPAPRQTGAGRRCSRSPRGTPEESPERSDFGVAHTPDELESVAPDYAPWSLWSGPAAGAGFLPFSPALLGSAAESSGSSAGGTGSTAEPQRMRQSSPSGSAESSQPPRAEGPSEWPRSAPSAVGRHPRRQPPRVEDLGDLPSRGSAFHASGSCKPCAFVFHGGCNNDAECPFCHLCEPGERKRRKKEVQTMRRQARQRKQQRTLAATQQC